MKQEPWCKTQCNAGLSKLVVTAEGKIFPCEAFKNIDAALLGNIYEGCNLEKALENMRSNRFLLTLSYDFNSLRASKAE